jgi:hypothetical protein
MGFKIAGEKALFTAPFGRYFWQATADILGKRLKHYTTTLSSLKGKISQTDCFALCKIVTELVKICMLNS